MSFIFIFISIFTSLDLKLLLKPEQETNTSISVEKNVINQSKLFNKRYLKRTNQITLHVSKQPDSYDVCLYTNVRYSESMV